MPVEYTNSLGMKFRLIPPGEFLMGSTKEEIEAALAEDKQRQEFIKSEAPQHKVILTQPIYLGVNEVTQAEYEKVMGSNPSHFAPLGMEKQAVAGLKTADHPVEMVSWNDAAEFCVKLSKLEKLKPFYFRAGETITPLEGTGYRLPSEAEWEFACRAGTATKYWIGDKDEDSVRAGWFVGNSGGRTHAAGELKANPFGLYDIHGNVCEWVQDGWDATYYGQFQEKPAINPNGPSSTGSQRVQRGGIFNSGVSRCRSSHRFAGAPTNRNSNIGFRVSLVAAGTRVSQALKVTGPAMPKSVATTPSAPASDPIDFAAERQAAEWVLKMGGTLGLADEQGKPMGLVEGNLPTINFVVKSAGLSGNGDVTDEGIANLAGCRRLEVLSLRNTNKVTTAGLASLVSVKSLIGLEIGNTGCGNEFLPLLGNWPRLDGLQFGGQVNPITDAGLRTLPQLAAMRRVYFESFNNTRVISDDGFARIGERCPNLETIVFQYLGEDVSLQPLQKMSRLKTVCCSGALITDAGIETLKSLPQLEHLWLSGGNTDEAIRRVAGLEGHITKLLIEQSKDVSADSWKGLSRLTRLKELQISGDFSGSFTDKVLEHLAQIPMLQTLLIHLPPERHTCTPAGISKFRELRPDVGFRIGDQIFNASSTIPFSVIRQLDETDPLPGWELPAGAPPPVVAPCEPTLATERQQQWAEFLKRPVIEENAATKLKFTLIPPGEFRKIFTRPRDPAIEPDMPVRRFRITKPYALSTTEVTWDQFRQFVEATGYQTEAETNGLGGRDRAFKADPKINWRTPGWKPDPNEPVTQVTPRDAEAFCAWLTESSHHAPRDEPKATDVQNPGDAATSTDVLPEGSSRGARGLLYRLPTEAEWLHACRAGSVHKHVVGPEPGDLADYAWTQEFLDPNPQASPLHLVAQKKTNPFGLHDTLGNVGERIGDFMTPAQAPTLPTDNPLGSRSTGVIGDEWSSPRGQVTPDWTHSPHSTAQANIGFRVLKQFDGEPLPGPLDRPLVLRAGQPMSVHALVPRPEKIPGLQSWSIELANGHGTSLFNPIAANPNGDLIAMGSLYGKISLWDRDGNYQRGLLGHENSVTSIHFSPDGRWLASGDTPSAYRGTMGCTVRIWNVATGALHALIPSPIHTTHGLKFSPDGKQLAVSAEDQYKTSFFIFDLATGQIRMPVTEEQRGRGLAWSPDSTKIASSATDGGNPSRLRIWDAATLKVLQDVECPLSGSLEWSPDGQWLAMQGSEGKVAIRDATTLTVTKSFDASLLYYTSHALAWLPDRKRLAASAADQGGVFDTETGDRLAKFNAGNSAIALLDEGKQAVFESGGRLHFYDTSNGQKLREGKDRGRAGGLCTLAPNGRDVFCRSRDRVTVFDVATGDRKRHFELKLPDGAVASVSPDSSSLSLIDGNLPTIPLVDAQSGVKRHELSHGQAKATRVAWSPDGKWLATGATDKLVRVWNVATGKIEHELAGHTGTIWSLAWSPDGTRLASTAEDKTVRLWNPLAGKLVATYDQFPEELSPYYQKFKGLAWTADSRRLWIALTNNIVPLDVETGTFGPLENFNNGNAVAFLNTSPDGQRLLVREGAGWTFVRGRDAQDRRLLGQYLGHTAQWHPDSRRFLGWEHSYGTVGFDVETNRRLGLLFPWLTGDHWLCLGPTGHYRGSPGVEDQFVYVAMLADGSQRTYTPTEFALQFGWKNDPEKAELLGK